MKPGDRGPDTKLSWRVQNPLLSFKVFTCLRAWALESEELEVRFCFIYQLGNFGSLFSISE